MKRVTIYKSEINIYHGIKREITHLEKKLVKIKKHSLLVQRKNALLRRKSDEINILRTRTDLMKSRNSLYSIDIEVSNLTTAIRKIELEITQKTPVGLPLVNEESQIIKQLLLNNQHFLSSAIYLAYDSLDLALTSKTISSLLAIPKSDLLTNKNGHVLLSVEQKQVIEAKQSFEDNFPLPILPKEVSDFNILTQKHMLENLPSYNRNYTPPIVQQPNKNNPLPLLQGIKEKSPLARGYVERELPPPIRNKDFSPKINDKFKKNNLSVPIGDLERGALLSKEQTEKAKQYFKDNPNLVKLSRYDKLRLPFSVIKEQGSGKLFALYRGKSHSLGKGEYATVKIAQNIDSLDVAAVKIQKNEVSKDIDNEVEVLKRVNQLQGRQHRNSNDRRRDVTARYADPCRKDYSLQIKPFAYKDYIFTDIGGPSLQKYIEKNNLTIAEKLKIILKIIDALKDLHAKRIIHTDIKTLNILYENENIQIIDYGLSSIMQPGKNHAITEVLGSIFYLPKETTVADHNCGCDKFGRAMYAKTTTAVDVFSLGILISHPKFGFGLINPKNRSDPFNICVGKMLNSNFPEQRPTLDEVERVILKKLELLPKQEITRIKSLR